MTKEHILAEIRRTAVENNGRPLGAQRLASETGIRYADWHGKYWARWSDALREAGYAPNKLNAPLPEVKLLSRLADLAQELGHFPVAGELRLKARSDPSFPSHNTFARFGPKRAMAARLREFCLSEGRVDVAALCMPATEATREVADHAGMPPGSSTRSVGATPSGGASVRSPFSCPKESSLFIRSGRTIRLVSKATGIGGFKTGGRTASGFS